MRKEIKLWLSAIILGAFLLGGMLATVFLSAYSANRGWNSGQAVSDDESVRRVLELLKLGAEDGL